jgi:GH24 family phage-related lysozyme (muramidase)
MSSPTFEEVKALIAPSEGNIAHMYLDSVGKVTVGIGNLLSTSVAACELPFVNRVTSQRATQAEIVGDFEEVSRQVWPRVARFYRSFTALDLPGPQIDELFRRRVDEFQRDLHAAYPDFEGYPGAAQLAMLDMAFNLGTQGLKKVWPNLNKAIGNRDWATAAIESYRPQSSATRNAKVKALFERAATEARAPLPPE